jgi:hypothetical protein
MQFLHLLLAPPSWANRSSLKPYSKTPSTCVHPIMQQDKLHSHINNSILHYILDCRLQFYNVSACLSPLTPHDVTKHLLLSFRTRGRYTREWTVPFVTMPYQLLRLYSNICFTAIPQREDTLLHLQRVPNWCSDSG